MLNKTLIQGNCGAIIGLIGGPLSAEAAAAGGTPGEATSFREAHGRLLKPTELRWFPLIGRSSPRAIILRFAHEEEL